MTPTKTSKHETITRISFGAFAFALVTLGCDPADEPVSGDELLIEDDEDIDALAANPADEDELDDEEELDEADAAPEATITDGPLPALESRAPDFDLTAVPDVVRYAWTGVWFSEETPPSTCPSANLVTGVACWGGWCNDMQLECHGQYALGGTSWTSWFSEEGTNYKICDGNGYVSGMACQGFWCDSLSLQCSATNTTPAAHTCAWSGWFSEEDTPFLAPGGTAIKGVQCNGGYCDQLRYYYCPI
jgi:hypothetical protein